MSLVHCVLLTNHSDASAATGGGWFQDVHVLEVVHLSVVDPALVVFGEDVGDGTDFEFLAVFSSLFLYIAPQIGFAAEAPCPCKVIDLLHRVHVPQSAWPDQWSPANVPTGWTLAFVYKMESCCFQGVDNAIICVSLTAYSKR